jgi:hypothetical protein
MIVANASSMLVPIVGILSNWQGNQNLQGLRISRMSEPGFGRISGMGRINCLNHDLGGFRMDRILIDN